jgi:hypothetical protein
VGYGSKICVLPLYFKVAEIGEAYFAEKGIGYALS